MAKVTPGRDASGGLEHSGLSRKGIVICIMVEHEVTMSGGGAAGLIAGPDTLRADLKSLLVEPGILRGQIVKPGCVQTYPGLLKLVSRFELGRKQA